MLPVVTVQPGSPPAPAWTTRQGWVKFASKLPSYTRLFAMHGGGGGGGALVHTVANETASIMIQPQVFEVAAKLIVVLVVVAVKVYEPFVQWRFQDCSSLCAMV